MDEVKVQTLSEVYCLLSYFPKTYVDKIPQKLLDLIKGFSNTKYFIEVDTTKPLEEQNISEETKNMLIVFKYNYWSSEEQKQRIIEKLSENENNYQKELRKKYNVDDIFKNRNRIIPEETQKSEETRMTVVQEEKWYQKIFNLIKGLFHRNLN